MFLGRQMHKGGGVQGEQIEGGERRESDHGRWCSSKRFWGIDLSSPTPLGKIKLNENKGKFAPKLKLNSGYQKHHKMKNSRARYLFDDFSQ